MVDAEMMAGFFNMFQLHPDGYQYRCCSCHFVMELSEVCVFYLNCECLLYIRCEILVSSSSLSSNSFAHT